MSIKRQMATAAPYIISSLMIFAATKQNLTAQSGVIPQQNTISDPVKNTNPYKAASWSNLKEDLYNFLSEQHFTLDDFELDDYHFSVTDLKKLTGSEKNNNMLQVARKRATKTGSFSHCYRGVKRILAGSGITLGAIANERSAYMAANSLASHPDFIEIKCEIKDIPNLPDGTIITWGRSRTRPHGHIEVKDGNFGRCDAKYNLRTEMGPYTKPHFFVLRDTSLELEAALKLIQENRLKANILDSIAHRSSIPVEIIAGILGISNDQCPDVNNTPATKIYYYDIASGREYKLPKPQGIVIPEKDTKLKLESKDVKENIEYQKFMDKVMYIRTKQRGNKAQRSRT